MSTYTQRKKAASPALPRSLKARIGRRTAANTETLRGHIPWSVEPTDRPLEIVDVFGVSYGTACVWLRILRGPVKRN